VSQRTQVDVKPSTGTRHGTLRPAAGPTTDLDKSNDEIVEATRAHFSTEPEFGPIDDFYRRRAEHIAER
jgi:hypothetical protein